MGKSRNKKIMKAMSAGALSTSILTTFFIPGQTSFAVTDSSTTIKDIDSYIKNISNADRERIHSMQETDYTGLMISPDVNLNEDTPLNVIVQFKQAPSEIDYKVKQSNGVTATRDESLKLVDESHKKFKDQLNGNSKLINSADIKREYKYVFNGVSMTLPANQVKELLNLDSVKAVYEDKEVSVEPIVEQNGEPANNSSINLNNMEQIGAEKLHNEGITGKGVKVGVIDTGIDYTHPDLKDVYKGGYDFVNNDSDPMETSYDDWKKSGQPEFNQLSGEPYYTAHGTHVSGIIAGTGKNHSNFAVTGVAPQVELYGYKVLGPYGSGGDGNIIAGIDKAVEDKMDVINLSLGAGITNPLDPMSVAINNATLAGTVCVLAAGNGGTGGKYTIGSPASSALGITVGANSSPITIQTNNAVANSVNETLKLDNMRMVATDYSDINTLKGSTLPIVFVGKGNTYEFTGKNVKDKIVLMERGDLTLNVKIKNAKANGAKAVIMFNNIPGETYIPYYFGNNFDFIPTFSIPNDQGTKLINMLNKGAVNLTMNDFGTFESEGDKLANFSSRGPARRYYDIKPEITAPGVAVFSSIPAYYNGAAHKDDYEHAYARFDGTSMAAPHVAGSAALILQAHPDYTPQQVKLALMNTADELNGSYSVFEKGSGRIDTDEAVHTSIQIGVKDEVATMEDGQKVMIPETSGDLSYGAVVTTDKDYKDKKSIEITNNSNKNKVFDVKVKFNNIPGYDQDAEKNGISLDMPSEVTAKVNGTSKIMPKLNVPTTAELGLYEGCIYFTNKDDRNEVYQIPFGLNKMEQGIKDVLLTTKAFNTRRDLPFAINGGTGIAFSLKSRMETVDIVLKNADTGEELGIIDSFDDGFNEGMIFGLDAGFNGLYFPFTGNPDQPVHITKSLASPGRYEIEIIGTNEDGKVFKKSKQIIIDNTLPTLKTNVPGGVYEVDDTGLKISGNITDSSIDLWNKNGENIDQSNNKVNVTSATNPFGNVPLVVDSKGNFEYTRMIQAGRDFSTMTLQSQDIATNGVQNHPDFTYTLIRKGLPYMKLTTDKSNAKYGETVKVTLNEQNIKNFMGGEFTIAYPYQLFDFQGAELNSEYVNAAKSMGLTAKLTAQDLKTDTSNNWVKLVTNLDGTTPSSGINANMPIATLTFKVKDDPSVYTKWVQQFGIQTAKANILGQPQTTITNKFGRGLNIIPTYSILEGGFLPDGFIPSNQIWLDPKKDYSKVGAEVYVIGGTDGKRYNATINSAARFSVKNLPLLDQSYEIVIKIPGHFERHVKVDEMVDSYDVMAAGKLKYFYYATMRAGDVNHDNVIDILDAVYITNKFNTNDREADINFDGVVDTKDLEYVKRNYLMKNPDAPSGHIQPVTKYKGKTIEDFFAPLG